MKYQSSLTKKVYEIDPQSKRTTCPECSHNRRKKEDKCVSWDLTNKRGYCQHCQAAFFVYENKPEKIFVVPDWKNITDLSDRALKWFSGRGISQETLKDAKIYSDNEYMPQHQKEVEVICFPFFRNDKQVNIKYRGAKKSFKLVSDAELIFFNHDVINQDYEDIIIVEGEIDALSFMEVGLKQVISVPNGAGNVDFIDSCINEFDNINNVYLATDSDKKGIELRDELARRIGFEKCLIVDFKDCKDANEYLIKHGGLELGKTIENAINYPVKGIVKVNDIFADIKNLFENGIQPGKNIQIPSIDKKITWELGRLAIITGIPGHGKSELIDFLIARLNLIYGWKTAYFTPENYPLKFHYAKLYEKFVGKSFDKKYSNTDEFNIAYEYIRDNFFYIMDEEDSSVDMVINSAKSLVKSKGIKILVIDPYNKLEHPQERGESETQYISRFLDKITTFAKFNNVLVFLIAHPTKMRKSDMGVYEVPNLYNISGSAHFFNKTDYGLTVYRNYNVEKASYDNTIELFVQKVKFKHLGETGAVSMKYVYTNGRFAENHEIQEEFDKSNWLIQ